MSETKYQVTAIGNAMVDVIVHVDDAVLSAHGMEKGAMTLIDAERADGLYSLMPPAIERSGGSAGNTIAGVASLGGTAAYIGKVSGDQFGQIFRHDIRAVGVVYDVPDAPNSATGRCLIFVTPDAQRTMNTYLGAGALLGPNDVAAETIESSHVVYLEGYLWDPPEAQAAFLKAAAIAHDAGRKVALTLSDPFCVDRHRESFRDLVDRHVDILFANEAEILSLYDVDSFDDALQRVRAECDIAALTRSAKGSVVVAGSDVHVIDAEPVARVVDTTGAGDLYAAGFLFGWTSGRDLATCGRIAGIAAAEVISHIGARPEVNLAELVKQKLS
jgi:sugar/nucleoside kinase (ribokinase family)